MDEPRIGISGWYGCGNIGDEAILQATIEYLKTHMVNCQISVFSEQPDVVTERYSKRYGIKGVINPFLYSLKDWLGACIKRHIFHWLNELRKCELFLLGGGGIIRDNTTPRNLWRLLDEVYINRGLGSKVATLGVSIGPICTRNGKRSIAGALRQCDLITVRDSSSYELAIELVGDCKRVMLGADPAFLLAPKEPSDPNIMEFIYRAKTRFGGLVAISLCDYGIFHDDLMREREKDALKLIYEVGKVCDFLIRKYEVGIILIPFRMYDDDNDLKNLKTLSEIVTSLNPTALEHLYTVNHLMPPDEVAGAFNFIDLVIGARLHSLILGVAQNAIPFGIAYSQKITSFMQSIGLSDNVIEIGKVSSEDLISRISSTIFHSNKQVLTQAREQETKAARMLDRLIMLISS